MNDIDALTLKLLTSKKKYNAYLETVEPDKSSEMRAYIDAVKSNRKRIISLFESYVDEPEKQITNELDDAIEFCLKEILKHFETRDRENASAKNDYDETSEGSDSCEATNEQDSDDGTNEKEESEDACDEPPKSVKQSFWGKTIMKKHFAK